MSTCHAAVRSKPAALLLVVGILLIAANLRAPFTSVAPLLPMIRATFSLDMAEAGLLTTLPLLCFAVMSPLTARLARILGLERAMFGGIGLIAAGIALRWLPPVWCLYLGTATIGIGIAIANVLLPSLVKRDFPGHVAMLTGAYAVTMGIAAALASIVAERLGHDPALGWRPGLASTLILPAATLLLWLPQLAEQSRPAAEAATHGRPIWRSALAWQVTLFIGFNSTINYVLVGWLPVILVDAGYSSAEAAWQHGIVMLASGLVGLFVGPVVARLGDQRLIAVLVSLLSAIGLAGLMLMPAAALLWEICFGAGVGAGFILSLIFFGLRTRSPQDAAALSGMAQGVGYSLAAIGPPVAGLLHDAAGGWWLPLTACILLSLTMAGLGWFAGRPILIGTR